MEYKKLYILEVNLLNLPLMEYKKLYLLERKPKMRSSIFSSTPSVLKKVITKQKISLKKFGYYFVYLDVLTRGRVYEEKSYFTLFHVPGGTRLQVGLRALAIHILLHQCISGLNFIVKYLSVFLFMIWNSILLC